MMFSAMKHRWLPLVVLLSVVVLAGPMRAQTTYSYDRNGALKGTARTANKTTRHYDRNGRFTGSARRSGNTTYFYGRDGEYNGSKRTSSSP
jgi:hypothetical protein